MMKSMVRKTKWALGGSFAVLGLLLQLNAGAHTVTGAGAGSCSPHEASGSNGGSQFFLCSRLAGSDDVFGRMFWCSGTSDCGKAICGGKSVCGDSTSDGTTPTGKAGGHKASVGWSECGVTLKTCQTGG